MAPQPQEADLILTDPAARELARRLERIDEKLDELLGYAREADTAVRGFLSGKNAKYLALLAKTKARL